jgi:hypothetical protein
MSIRDQLDELGPLSEDEFVVDLGDTNAAQDMSSSYYSAGSDTITISNPIDSIDLSGICTITLPSSSGYYGCYGATVGGITTAQIAALTPSQIGSITPSNTITWSGGTNYTNGTGYSFANSPSTVHINTSGIEMAAGTDLKIDGQSLKEFMKKMEQRLAILVPDPKKLEKFEALKKAYEHYKTMESLCFDEPIEGPKQ